MTYKYLLLILHLFISAAVLPQNYVYIKYSDRVESENLKNRNNLLNIALSDNAYHKYIKDIKPLSIKNNIRLNHIFKINFSDTNKKDQIISELRRNPEIEYVQLPVNYNLDIIPNDSLYSEQWGTEKIGAEQAWEHTTGSDSIIIAVIDTGIDYNHSDLFGQFYVNSDEDLNSNGILDDADINGIDDDGNGFIDDVIGWDFTDRAGFPFDEGGSDYLNWDNDPMDEQGHGTNVAGIISAKMNNSEGIAGIASGCKLMNLRAFDPSGYGEEDDVAAAILYAVNNGADVINMSFGDDSFSYVLRDVIEYAYSQGVVFVGSAGNSSSDIPHYPSSYPEVISVGASTNDDIIASFSNTGSSIDLVAPGLGIITTDKSGKYAYISGTSASAPFVSASAGLILSKLNVKNEEVKQIIKSTTDDIMNSGWDLSSGAGRVNIGRAMQLSVPSIIKINSPIQDFASSDGAVKINATILSPYFASWSLLYGVGLNPGNWTSLINSESYQFSNEDIYDLQLPVNIDTSYTIRLVVELNNGRTLEERVNIYIDTTPPEISLINLGPGYFGEISTIFASVYSDDISIVKLFYRTVGSNDFKFVTMDGFATNNKFVKQLSWGFIPKSIVLQDKMYEIYLEAENLAGLKTILKDDSQYFNVKTDPEFDIAPSKKLDYSLPPGRIFKDPVNITSNNFSEILLNDAANSKYMQFYKLIGQSFIKQDSLYERIPKTAGDFNSDGKTDILSLFIRNGFIDEQIVPGTTDFFTSFSDSSGDFWPVLAQDIDGDGKTEVLSVYDESSIQIWEADNELNLSLEATLENYTESGLGGNSFESPNASITTIYTGNKNEIWMVDADGDILSYFVDGPDQYSDGIYVSTGFYSENNLTSGDFNGDGKPELAVLLKSIPPIDIAPFNLLIVMNFSGAELNLIYQRAFIDPSAEFSSGFNKAESSIRLTDTDSDGIDELAVFAFPYSYILKANQTGADVIFFKENVNSNQIFVGDLNGNGAPEVSFPLSDKIEFYEFGESLSPSTPFITSAFSIDSANIKLEWNSTGTMNYVYRGLSAENLVKSDSTNASIFIDTNLIKNKFYYYAVQTKDNSKPEPLSQLSQIVQVFSHQPAEPIKITANNQSSILLEFSNKVKNKIDNLEAFEVLNGLFPNSISAASETSYLLSFSNPISAGMHDLAVIGHSDLYGSPIKNDTLSFVISEDVNPDEFFITSYSLVNTHKLKIEFNLEADELSALQKENYLFSPINNIKSLTLSNDKKTVILEVEKPIGSIGIEYILDIQDVFSSVSSGSVKINEGAGSFIVISTFAATLDEMYVYPHPVKISEHNKVTFANLTKVVEISILTLEGKRVIDLKEEDGNGGLDWNLRNDSGELVSSGIYIYRAVSKDANGNEKQIKLGKIAVIR